MVLVFNSHYAEIVESSLYKIVAKLDYDKITKTIEIPKIDVAALRYGNKPAEKLPNITEDEIDNLEDFDTRHGRYILVFIDEEDKNIFIKKLKIKKEHIDDIIITKDKLDT